MIGRSALPWLVAVLTAALVAACSTPSTEIDGGDLLGVFDRDAAAAPDGSSRGKPATSAADRRLKAADAGQARASTSGLAIVSLPPEPSPGAPRPRAPNDTTCVAPEGHPARDVRRTLGRPACRDAQILEWKDADGAPRYACVIAPRGVETRAPLPLVIFFHGPEDDPTSVDKKTGLRKLGARFDLSGDPSHTGFIVLAPQGRAIKGREGAVFDTEYTGADHVDMAVVDHFVGILTAQKLVDRRRIYALGLSSGGHMAATYAMMRADRVAAFAAYASDGPRAVWSCPGPPPPAMVVYRACDSVFACDATERWLRARDALSADTSWLRLGAANEDEPNCTVKNKCSKLKGSAHHRRWPKGREEALLKFFAGRTLLVEP